MHLFIESSFRVEPLDEYAVSRCRDPKDDMFLSLARQVEADFIVTLDDDLLALKAEGSVKILAPGTYLRR